MTMQAEISVSDVIPISSGDVLFAIEKSDPDTVKIYRYADALPSGEPLKATPHKACAQIAPSDFSSSCTRSTPAG